MSCGLNQQPFEMFPPGGTTPGGATTLSNVGGGADLVNAVSGGNYPIKTLLAGTNTSLTVGANTITINSTGGLTYWTESEYTYSALTGTKLIPNSVNTNQSVVLSPKGNGFISAQQPDGTAAGGDNRGNNAVDLQMSRAVSSNVAAGGASFIGGGYNNNTSAYHTVVGGGSGNTAGGAYGFVGGGKYNYAGGTFSAIGGGYQNTAGGDYSFVGGGIGNTAYSFAESVLGSYPTTYTPASATGFNSTDRLFVLGNGTATGSRSNAFVVFKDGTVEINEAYTLPNVDGTVGQVPVTDGAGNVAWGTIGAGGLTHWTESAWTYSLNQGRKLTPNGGGNEYVVIQPTGNGGLLATQPDGTATGGNIRGNNVVDWQVVRGSADQVASAATSVIAGGNYNKATGVGSVISGGSGNVTVGSYTTISGGRNHQTDGYFSAVIGGEFNSTVGKYAIAGGVYVEAPSYGEIALGLFPTTYTAGSSTAIVGTDRLFVLGNGTATGSRSNAFTVFKNGKATLQSTLTIGAYTLPATDGTSNQVLKTNGSGVLTWYTPSAGGLTYWTESEYTYSGKTGTKLIPNSVNTNQSVVLSPKGTGFISAQQPDGTTTVGNSRGNYAVDLQMSRSGNLEVAEGDYSVIGGGKNNKTFQYYDTICGGYNNQSQYYTANAGYSFIGGGQGNRVEYGCAIVGGTNNLAKSGYFSFIGGGQGNQINSGRYSSITGGAYNQVNITAFDGAGFIGGGSTNQVTGIYGVIGGGYSNEINSAYSTIAGGNNLYIGTGASSAIVGGDNNTINGTGAYSFIGGGRTNTINATAFHYNFIGGGYANSIVESERCMILGGSDNMVLADAQYSAIIGHNCKAEAGGKHSIAMGYGAISKRYGERVMSSGALQTLGDNSFAEVQLLARTTSATPQEMYCGGASGERFAISYNSTTLVKYRWVRRKLSDNTTIATHDYYVLVDKGATAGSINIVAQWEDTCLTPATGNDGSFAGGVDDIVVSADTTNGTLKFTATGQAGQTLLWFLRAEAMEIKV